MYVCDDVCVMIHVCDDICVWLPHILFSQPNTTWLSCMTHMSHVCCMLMVSSVIVDVENSLRFRTSLNQRLTGSHGSSSLFKFKDYSKQRNSLSVEKKMNQIINLTLPNTLSYFPLLLPSPSTLGWKAARHCCVWERGWLVDVYIYDCTYVCMCVSIHVCMNVRAGFRGDCESMW